MDKDKVDCNEAHHYSTNWSWLPQTSRNRLVNIDELHLIRYDLIFYLTYVSCLTILYTYISNNNSVVIYWGLLKGDETPYLPCFSLISLRKFNVNTSNCNSPVSQYERPRAVALASLACVDKSTKNHHWVYTRILLYIWNERIKYCNRYYYEENWSVLHVICLCPQQHGTKANPTTF